ncbi:MAG TPA: NAD(P)-dependent oxidoreductase [Chloroflexota bacterium]|nr:NAD(P)-dependent oxidoreductase [Chloroflexota bacterium]
MSITKAGYIGLGNMGLPIAANLISGGFDVMVHDIRDEPMRELARLGAKTARSAAEVGRHSELVELSVVDDAQVEEAILGKEGIVRAAAPGTIVAVHSTIHPRTIKHVSAEAQAFGVIVLDAAVSGGKGGAAAAQLTYMVGGDREAFEKAKPAFQTSGAHIFYMGDVGAGSATKLAQQVIVCINRLSGQEGMRLAEAYGLDVELVQQVVHTTGAQSQVTDNWLKDYKRMAAADEESAKRMAHLFWKGLCPALELGHELGLSMPGTALVQQTFPKVLGFE